MSVPWQKGQVPESVFFSVLPLHSSAPVHEKTPTIGVCSFCRVFLVEIRGLSCLWFTVTLCSLLLEHENRMATSVLFPSTWECQDPQYDFHSNTCSFCISYMISLFFKILSSLPLSRTFSVSGTLLSTSQELFYLIL